MHFSITDEHNLRFTLGRFSLAAAPRLYVGAFALFMLAMIWSAVTYEVMQDRRDALAEWTGNLTNLTRSFQEHTMRMISAVDQDVKYVRKQYLQHGNVDIVAMARDGAIDIRPYDHIGLLAPDGTYFASSHQVKPASLADRDYFKVHVEDSVDYPYIGVPVIGRQTGKWAVHLSRRLTLPGGGFGGVVAAAIDPNYLSTLYNDVDLGAHSAVVLIGEDTIVRARRVNNNRPLGESLAKAPYFNELKSQSAGSVVFEGVDGITRLYTFRRLPEYSLIVVIGISLDHVYARSVERKEGYVVVGLIASAITLIFTLLINRLVAHLQIERAAAQSANRLKSEFLASMSHELRTPLNGVLGFADILRRKAGSENDRRKAEIIHSSGSHLLSLLNSILDLAKIEAGRMDVYLRREELVPLIQTTVQIHEVNALSKGVRLELKLADKLPQHIKCDTTLLRQVLNNLISNAIKFTSQGSVTVCVEHAAQSDTLRFAVRDTGMGIPADAVGKVFEKFLQVDQSMTRTHQGTGLGLSLAKQLVELMGGSIGLNSEVDVGTTIYFTLPTHLGDMEAAPIEAGGMAKS